MEMQNLLNSSKINQFTESQPDPDFFQGNTKKTTRKNWKKSKPYSNTKVKATNFLTNIAYKRYQRADFEKK